MLLLWRLLACSGPWCVLVFHGCERWEVVGTVICRGAAVRERISVVSHCVCGTNISDCRGGIAGDLLHPSAEIQMCTFLFLFCKSQWVYTAATNLLTNTTITFHVWVTCNIFEIRIRPRGYWLVYLECQDTALCEIAIYFFHSWKQIYLTAIDIFSTSVIAAQNILWFYKF